MPFLVVSIESITKHPDATKLKICQVKIGDGVPLVQIVCGATNVREKMKTILATVGTKLSSGTVISEATLRGILSSGMLCSPKDVNAVDESGLIDLPDAYQVGMDIVEVKQEHLSSTPWHRYKLCERFFLNPQTKKISIQRKNYQEEIVKGEKIVSETYFHEGSYLVRNFPF